MLSYQTSKINANAERRSLVSNHQNILNSPNFPELEFKQMRNSLSNKSFVDENREKQNISKFTLGANFYPINTPQAQVRLKIEDLKVKKNQSIRYKDENIPISKLSLKEKQILKQKIDEDKDYFLDSEKDIENMGVGYQNILNNQNNQCTVKFNNDSKLKYVEKSSIQTFNTEALSFESENKDFDPFINQKYVHDYTKIFIPVLMEEKDDIQEFKEGFLEIGDSIVDLYKIEGVLLKTEKHIVYSAIGLSNNIEDERFRIKMYNHLKKDAFDFGLAEISNYLYLYERNVNFKKNGISKLRDYFYLNESLFTVTECIGNPIISLNKNHLNLSTIKELIYKIMFALSTIHDNNLIHLNLNFNSILYKLSKNSKIEINLVDFNNAKIMKKRRKKNYNIDNYSAPELILGMDFDQKVDMWSIGCMLYELLTNEPLFFPTTPKNLIYMIKKVFSRKPLASKSEFEKDISFLEDSEGFASVGVNNKQNNEMNIKINDIKYNLNILKENPCLEEFMLGLLKVNPNQRFSSQEALEHAWFKSSNINLM